MLQICHPASFASNSLSIPFPQDGGQVLLDGHLLPVATVAVREDAVRVSLGQGLRAVLLRLPPAVTERQGWGGEERGGNSTIITLMLHVFNLGRGHCNWRKMKYKILGRNKKKKAPPCGSVNYHYCVLAK